MNKPTFNLNRQAFIAALISAAFPLSSHAAAGRVEFAVGGVNALGQDGTTRSLAKGGEINNGDTIQTIDGRAQIRFSDGGYISLQPNTEFKVEDYSYSGKSDGSEKGFFSLVKGGLRAITGAIGHTNKQAYRVNTPVATIGIRGTEYLAQYNNTKLLVKVGDGAVYLVNSAGDIVLYKGQVGEAGEGSKPQYSTEQPSVGSAGPTGGTPQQTQQEQQNQQQQQNIFVAGELRDESGDPCAVTNTCFTQNLDQLNQLLQGPLANLSQLAALNAGAVYAAQNLVTLTGFSGSTMTGNIVSALAVNFMTYDAVFSVGGNLQQGASGPVFTVGGVAHGYSTFGKGLNPANGLLAFDPGTLSYSGSGVSGADSLNVNSAALNSTNLSKATVVYMMSLLGYSGTTTANMIGYASAPAPDLSCGSCAF